MRLIVSSSLMIMLVLHLGACGDTGISKLPVVPADVLGNAKKISLGQELFMSHCAECHGSIAEGRTQRAARFNPPAPDFHERRYQQSIPGYLYVRIERGRELEPFNSMGSVMPPWRAHLKENQIWSLVAFIHARAQTTEIE